MINISVVIPTFNSAQTISRSLESILVQSLRPRQVIVVDDCSSDATTAIVASMEARFRSNGIALVLLTSRVNAGGAVSRNRGLDKASGDVVALLDSDDVWLPHHLKSSVCEGKDRDCVVVSRTRQILLKGKERILPEVRLSRGASPLDYIFRDGGVIQTSSIVLFGRARELRFDERLRKHQDFDFMGAAHRAGLEIAQRWDCSTEYHDYGGEGRVSVRKNLSASRIFYLKWRLEMQLSARRAFLARFAAQQLPNNKNKSKRLMIRSAILDKDVAISVRIRLLARIIRGILK